MKTFKQFDLNENTNDRKIAFAMKSAALWLNVFADHGQIKGVDLKPNEKKQIRDLARDLEIKSKQLK